MTNPLRLHNLRTVVRFEVARTLKKKSFWIAALAFPFMIGVVFVVIFFSNKATDQAAKETQNQNFSIGITDDSRLLSATLLKQADAHLEPGKQAGIDAVKAGKLDAYFYYPSDVGRQKVEVYAKDVGLFNNSRYQAVAKSLLQQSVSAKTNSQVVSVLRGDVGFDATTYKDGKPFNGFQQLIAPGVFLVLFYALIVLFGNRMLASVTEEKENRVIEMILTTIEPRAFIAGKILSLVVLGFVQVLTILIPVGIAYALLHDKLALPSLDLSHIAFDPLRIGLGAILFTLSFLLFTGLLVSISAMTPTAKEAGGFFGIVMLLLFGPLYAASLFVSSPGAALVKVLTFFPFTAPIPLLLRNAVGNLSVVEALIAIVILFVTAVLVMWYAIAAFRYGALEYSRRFSPKELFTRR